MVSNAELKAKIEAVVQHPETVVRTPEWRTLVPCTYFNSDEFECEEKAVARWVSPITENEVTGCPAHMAFAKSLSTVYADVVFEEI